MVLVPGQEIAERYEIIDKIGSGGMANVYKALDKKLRRFVTFKVMREEFVTDDDFIKRFEVEARAAASLLNQHIVNVYDVGWEEDIHYIVMEYVDGVTLKALIKRRAPFENDELLGVAIQIATALEHAHKNNIIHRDIKPQNILVTRGGISKVTDFGIARAATTSTITTTSNAMGSVHYFSPEQARGGFVDIKSDIYSLGIVMYEMATGQLPYDGDTPIAIALKHINEPLPDPKQINPKLSDKVVNIIKKATAKLSADRYQNITEMGNDLKRALTNSSEDYGFGESATLTLTDEDIEAINRESAMNQPETKVPKLKRSAPQEPEDDFDDFDDYDDGGLFSDKKVVIAAVLTSFVLILLISALLYSVFWKPGAEVGPIPLDVPEFAGWTMEEANTVADSLGIEIKVEGEEASDSVVKGNIISQSYDGDAIYEGGTLWVVLSQGSDKYEVPDVTLKMYDDAYRIFDELNYPLVTAEVFEGSDDVIMNAVIRQEPAGGTLVPAKTLVTLYFSTGPKQTNVIVPNLVDKTEGEAINALQDIGLAAARAIFSASATVPEGKVIRQMISEGKEVPKGTVVEFVVSTGPPAETPAQTTETPDTPQKVTKTFPIELTNIPEGAETVHVLVILSTAAGGNTTVFDNTVNVADLPVQVTVSGTGHAELIVFTRDEDGGSRIQGSQNVDFTEGAE